MSKVSAQTLLDDTWAVEGVTALLPDTHFAVVVFRDFRNPAGEYELLQPMTRDPAQVEHALGRIRTSSNPTPGNGPAESYNLAFHNSCSDPAIGWRPEARKRPARLGRCRTERGGHCRTSRVQGSLPGSARTLDAAGARAHARHGPNADHGARSLGLYDGCAWLL